MKFFILFYNKLNTTKTTQTDLVKFQFKNFSNKSLPLLDSFPGGFEVKILIIFVQLSNYHENLRSKLEYINSFEA